MKKTLAIFALALFIGGMSAPVIAASNSGDCSSEKKSDCSSKCGGES